MRLRTRNAMNLLGLDAVDWGQSPTEWQRSQYPKRHRDRITVVHEGVDTSLVQARSDRASLWLSGGRRLSRTDEIVTYSARDLEPYRGFHVFMRALPRVLQQAAGGAGADRRQRRRQLRTPAREGVSWRAKLLAELDGRLDLRRVHFLGHLPYQQYLTVLQISTVHVYLTYPFVLSWSLLEAMSAGCFVVGSRTPPVEEVMRDGENGQLVDFFDVEGLADRITDALDRDNEALRSTARETVLKRYDLDTVCLPAYLGLLRTISGAG